MRVTKKNIFKVRENQTSKIQIPISSDARSISEVIKKIHISEICSQLRRNWDVQLFRAHSPRNTFLDEHGLQNGTFYEHTLQNTPFPENQ